MSETFSINTSNYILKPEITRIWLNGKIIGYNAILKDNNTDGSYWPISNGQTGNGGSVLYSRLSYFNSNEMSLSVYMGSSGTFVIGNSVTIWATLYYTKNS